MKLTPGDLGPLVSDHLKERRRFCIKTLIIVDKIMIASVLIEKKQDSGKKCFMLVRFLLGLYQQVSKFCNTNEMFGACIKILHSRFFCLPEPLELLQTSLTLPELDHFHFISNFHFTPCQLIKILPLIKNIPF